MNNWFVYLSVFEELYDKVVEEVIESENFNKPAGVLYNKSQKKEVNVENYTQLDSFSDLIQQSFTHKPDLEFIKKLERDYAISALSLTIMADRHFGYDEKILNYKQKLSIIELTFRYAINLNQNVSFKFAWFESVGDFFSYVLYLVFKKFGVEICCIVHGQFPGKIAISNNEQLIWNGVEEELIKISEIGPSKEEINKAQKFLVDYRSNLPVPSRFTKGSIPSLKYIDFKLFIKWVKASLGSKPNSNIFYKSPFRLLSLKLMRIFRSLLSRRIFDRLSENDPQDYVFFPLHFQPEMTTLVCAPFCINQVAVIEDIAKSLPAGTELIVKEHHGSVGRRRIIDYLDIKKNWNVRLVGPHEDTMNIIKNSKAVVTINSTVGLQGLLLGKPVVTLARVGYDASPAITRAHNIPRKDLSNVLKKAMDSTPNERDILFFLISVDRVLIDGADGIILEHPSYNPTEVLGKKNIRNISNIIKTHFLKTT